MTIQSHRAIPTEDPSQPLQMEKAVALIAQTDAAVSEYAEVVDFVWVLSRFNTQVLLLTM